MSNERQENSVRFEAKDVPPFLPLWLGAGLAGFVIIVLGGITLFYPLADQQENRGPTQPLPPAPQLQPAPASDLSRYQAAKQKELRNSAAPIDRAMRETAQQGWGPPR